MRHLPLMLVALAPLAGIAAQGDDLKSKVNLEKLQQDTKASEIIGSEVREASGKEAGEVEDLVIGMNGRIEAVLLNTDDELFNDDAGAAADGPMEPVEPVDDGLRERQDVDLENADRGQAGEQATIGKPTDSEDLRKVNWSKVNYDPSQDQVTISGSGSGTSDRNRPVRGTSSDAGSSAGQRAGGQPGGGNAVDSFRASEIIGMEVHLEDAKSFGSVEDVLIDTKQGKATAFLVDAWEGLDKQTYALPVNIKAINSENDSIDYPYTESDVVALQEYEAR